MSIEWRPHGAKRVNVQWPTEATNTLLPENGRIPNVDQHQYRDDSRHGCHGGRKLMPRPFHPKRDVEAQNAFKKTAFAAL
jgi:hypothetical protein